MPTTYLSKRNNGIYYYGVRLPDGRIKWTSTRQTARQNAQLFIKTIVERQQKEQEENKNQMPAFSQFYDTYSTLRSSTLKKGTLNLLRFAYATFIESAGDRILNEYTPLDVEKFKQFCLQKKLSVTTVNMYFRSIKAMFSQAMKFEILDKSPFRNSTLVKAPERRPVYLSKEEVQKLLDAVPIPTLRDLFQTAVLSGMRRAELINLRWENIDFEKRQMNILNSAGWQSKTGKERSVPMHETVYEILKRRSLTRGGFENYVFCKPGGFKYNSCHVTHKFRKYCDRVGLPKTVHLHTLRHTTASLLVNAGISLYEVQKILGHQDISTTQIYAHIAPSTLLQSINRI